ncbi:hypothetical protein ACLKA7_006119 [Drosophila subpalustris]
MNRDWMPQPLTVAAGRVAAAIARDERVSRQYTKAKMLQLQMGAYCDASSDVGSDVGSVVGSVVVREA